MNSDGSEEGRMRKRDDGRRNFLRHAGRSLIGAGASSAFVFSSSLAFSAGKADVTQTRKTQKATTPEEALRLLKEGNARFVNGESRQRNFRRQVEATEDGQFPIAAIVGCIDSRAPNELIFDQGIGDIFGARIAGNFVDEDILGSLEFACAVAGAKLIVVVGHTDCGAIKGAVDNVVLGNLTQTLAHIRPAVEAVSGFEPDRTSRNAAFVQAVADKNVELALETILTHSAVLRKMTDKGEVGLAGAMYDLGTGRVDFM